LENWRFAKKTYIADRNTSPEKTLEKTIAKITDADWVNQVPTASGLWNASADTHRNIDLVHRLGPKQYEFIELKVETDTPLKAAMESLIYGCFMFSPDFTIVRPMANLKASFKQRRSTCVLLRRILTTGAII
jgi:hypothetical protein